MIIGLTGTLASGKGVVANFFKEKGFVYLSLSDEVRALASENKIEITRKNLQDFANKIRAESGSEAFAKIVLEKIKNQRYTHAIVDGVRNPAEVDELKKLKNFFLIAVDAPMKNRFERLVTRNRESDPKDWEGFVKVDERDRGAGEEASGQQVGKCVERADFILINDGSLEETKSKVNNLFEKIEAKIPRPIWDEYFIEIMEVVASRATCNRGKVGCVIAKNKQILVSGYAGSPIGLAHCDEIGHQIKTVLHEDGTTSQHCMRTAHAEQNAICQAAKLGVSIDGSTLYCRMTPCSTCAKMIINSGIKRVVAERRYHQGKESEEMFSKAGVALDILNDEVQKY